MDKKFKRAMVKMCHSCIQQILTKDPTAKTLLFFVDISLYKHRLAGIYCFSDDNIPGTFPRKVTVAAAADCKLSEIRTNPTTLILQEMNDALKEILPHILPEYGLKYD